MNSKAKIEAQTATIEELETANSDLMKNSKEHENEMKETAKKLADLEKEIKELKEADNQNHTGTQDQAQAQVVGNTQNGIPQENTEAKNDESERRAAEQDRINQENQQKENEVHQQLEKGEIGPREAMDKLYDIYN